MMNNWKSSIHPVEILADELEEIDLTISQLAQNANLKGDIALKLGRFFNTGAELWMNLQKAYELDVARDNLGNRLEEIIPYQPVFSL
jgi:plasmid maintenance system antidote protein VapI